MPKNFTLMDVKRVVNLLDSDLQGLEETLQHHPSLCFLFLEMHKNKRAVLPETLSVYPRSLDILGKAAGEKKKKKPSTWSRLTAEVGLAFTAQPTTFGSETWH